MTQPDHLAQSVANLLDGVSQQALTHLAEVETDLAQTALLLSEAIEKLGASFMAIHAAVSAQQELVALLPTAHQSEHQLPTALQEIQREIGRHVNAAVTGLQFQDMTNQLIDRSLSHVSGLRGLIDVLADSAADMGGRMDDGALAVQLRKTSDALELHKESTSAAQRKAVTQTHMESGDIELF